ncbi:hypothetical protein UlMin_036195 [Ulmus minor]
MATSTTDSYLIFSLLLAYCFGFGSANYDGNGSSIKGMFVFGASQVDNGNNNFLGNSLAKANYAPYGIDFPLGPSGRFTNGKNLIDLLGEKLRLPSFVPVFSDPSTKGSRILHGVNFASGASGILEETGFLAGNVINLKQQIRDFENVTLPELEELLGCSSTQLLGKYLFVVETGANDYSFNYFLRGLNRYLNIDVFTSYLTASLSRHIKKLYGLGGRKFVLMSINPIGCSPMVKMVRPREKDGCVQGLNRAAHLFNTHLKSMVDILEAEMPGSSFVFLNSYKIIRAIIKYPSLQGFRETNRPCCEVATVHEGGNGVMCKKGGQVCANRSSHVFFDGLHPTEAVNILLANKAYASTSLTEVYPTNIQQLAKTF